jgi:hypothetical protein
MYVSCACLLVMVSNTYCVVICFVLFFYVLCTLCCQFLWIVHFLLSLCSCLTFIVMNLKWALYEESTSDIYDSICLSYIFVLRVSKKFHEERICLWWLVFTKTLIVVNHNKALLEQINWLYILLAMDVHGTHPIRCLRFN